MSMPWTRSQGKESGDVPAAVLEAAPSRAALDQHAARQWEVAQPQTRKSHTDHNTVMRRFMFLSSVHCAVAGVGMK